MAKKILWTPDRFRFLNIFKHTMTLVDIEDIEQVVKNSYSFTEEDVITFESKHFNTKIYLDNKDTFDKAIEIGPDVAVLNMASFKNPGGRCKNWLSCSRRMLVQAQ